VEQGLAAFWLCLWQLQFPGGKRFGMQKFEFAPGVSFPISEGNFGKVWQHDGWNMQAVRDRFCNCAGALKRARENRVKRNGREERYCLVSLDNSSR
jgi:hypothetical protein